MKENLGPSPSPADLVRINDGLLQAVVEAKAAFATAKLASAKAKELNEHLGGNHPDGTAALLNALRAERAATDPGGNDANTPVLDGAGRICGRHCGRGHDSHR